MKISLENCMRIVEYISSWIIVLQTFTTHVPNKFNTRLLLSDVDRFLFNNGGKIYLYNFTPKKLDYIEEDPYKLFSGFISFICDTVAT